MKKIIFLVAALTVFAGCYDDTGLWESIKDHESRISELEKLCTEMNTNISSLQTIVEALEIDDYVTGITPIEENGRQIGYSITFAKASPVNIYNGKDGKDGVSPTIGVRQEADGKHYWTLDGTWMLDEAGNKVPATGENGADGAQGEPGAPGEPGQDGAEGKPGNDGRPGEDGKDGITPELKIEDDYWYVSYNGGDTWSRLGKATGENGKDGNDGSDGDSIFSDIDYTTDGNYVIFTLSDGYAIKLPTWTAYEAVASKCEEINSSIMYIQALISSLQNYDFVASITPIMEDGKEIGCTIKFTKGRKITVYYGTAEEGGNTSAGSGTGSTTPLIGVRIDTDGKYYWTLDGEWLTDDSGNKIPTTGENGKDGQDGAPGQNGAPGQDGQDGITPQFKIENKYWHISYDNGLTWTELGKATGEDGADGSNGIGGVGSGSLFQNVEYSSDGSYVVFTLKDSTAIKLPTWAAYESLAEQCRQTNDNIKALQEIITALQNCDYITEVIPVIENGKEAGYIMKFFKGGSVTIYHGQDGADGKPGQDGMDGKDGTSPVIGVRQDTDGVYYWTLNGEWLLSETGDKIPTTGKDGQDGAPGADGADGKDAVTPMLKAEDNVWYISYDNGQSWSIISSSDEGNGSTGSENTGSSSCMFKNVEWDERNVYLTLTDDTTLTIPVYGEIEIVFEETEGITCLAGQTVTIGYTLYGSDNRTVVECITDNGWKASVKPSNVQTGEITVTAPSPLTEGKVLVFVSNGMGRTYMTVLTFNKGTLSIGTPKYYANATSGNITVDVVTNVDYSVQIVDAPEWIKFVPATKAATRTDHLTFSLAANPILNERSAMVELVDIEGAVLETFQIIQKGNKEGAIVFEDPLVEEICIANFDTDQDSLITKNELMAVKSIGTLFKLKAIKKFNELQYFTNVTVLDKEAFYGCTSLTEITLPNSLTAIYSEALYDCSSLTSIQIPSSVQTIGERAFSSCRALESISLPEGLKSIEQYTFSACYALKSVYLPESLEYIKNNSFQSTALSSVDFPKNLITIGMQAFSNCDNLTEAILPEGMLYLNESAFNDCDALVSVSIPSTVSVIGASAFYDCDKLTDVSLAEGLLTIGNQAFKECPELENISLPSSLMYIEDAAFKDCSSLKSIEIPSKVKTIEYEAFRACRSLTEVKLPDGLATIGQHVFSACDALESIEIPESVKYIQSQAFYSCSSLKNINLPDDLYELGQAAFSNCDALEEVMLPDNLTSLYSTFENCDNLKSVTLPSGLLTISRAFENCISLESIVIPETVKEIDWYSFRGCKSLKKINLPESIITIEDSCFSGCESLTEINWPSGLKYIEQYAFSGSGITNGDFPSTLSSIGGYAFSSCTGLTKVVLPEGITKINGYVFQNCTNLQEIEIPKTVTSIESYSFYRCSELTEISLPDDITTIGDYAFSECTKLREFTCPELLREIPNRMLYGCDSLKTVHFHEAITKIGSYAFAECQSLNELILPDCLTSIPSSMCSNCTKLTSVVIPSGITSIGSSAFDSCLRLSEVICTPVTPPTLSSYAFDDIYPTAKFYVPAESLDTYKEASGWKSFSSSMAAIVEE